MKTLRICLLILLAVLLPIRGAVAAAMLCPPAGMSSPSGASASVDHAMHHHEAMAEAADQQHGDHHASGADVGGTDVGGTGKCNLCCAFCGMTPLLSSLPTVPMPLMSAAVSFPDFSVPAASFLSDGQERPPRSI